LRPAGGGSDQLDDDHAGQERPPILRDVTEHAHDFEVLRPNPNERGRRLFAAAQARALGCGGIAGGAGAVARQNGVKLAAIISSISPCLSL